MHIGTLNEKPLHASLKQWIAQPEDQIESVVDGYCIDIVRNDLLIEIQTASFSSMKSKLQKLLPSRPVHLVYPIAKEKWIVKLPRENEKHPFRRKSPQKGVYEDIFKEMIRIPQWIGHVNFSVEILMIHEEEVRQFEANKNWRRKGWGVVERRLIDVVDQKVFDKPEDWRAFIPSGLNSFTVRKLAESKGIRKELAQKMVYCLKKAGIIQMIGKQGRAYVYKII